ncbi:hypothetical protein LNO36_02550 [Klebsiella variicola subsp. variicola]|nr:hypothetical protein [Klebsiella variicola subsp. variicola]
MIALMGGGPPRRQPVGEVGGAKPRQGSTLPGEPALEPKGMMMEMPDDIPRLAGQQPGFEGDKGQVWSA